MNNEMYEKFASLILKTGIALKPGQCLMISAEPIHWDFVNMLERTAYKQGARYVYCELRHARGQLNRTDFSRKEYLEYVPDWTESKVKTMVDEKWSLIRLTGEEDPDLLKDMNQKNSSIITKKILPLMKPLSTARSDGRCSWTITALPTPSWAAKVLGGEANEAKSEELWKLLIPIYRLDKPDPAEAWKKHSEALQKNCRKLNDLKLNHLHYKAPGTDLKIYLSGYSRWIGGSATTEDNRQFLPNIPTEEIFTTPDLRLTEGRVKTTRPVRVLERQVLGAWFEFEKGKVVRYGAYEGKDALDAYFSIDPKSRYLGEAALVDVSSPVYKSGKIFHSILFDENASSHIALGKGFPMAYSNSEGKSPEELDKLGCNNSLLHTDFMIGSEEFSVTGITEAGEKIPIINKGRFVI